MSLALPPALVERAGAFWHWWIAELAAMVPPPLRLRRERPRADIVAGPEGVAVERVEAGAGERLFDPAPLERLEEESWAELHGLIEGRRARLVLGPPDVFLTRIALPAAARGRLRAATSLALDQAAPVAPDLLCWNCRLIGGGGSAGTLDVLVAMARVERLEVIRGLFTEHGLAPPPIAARGPDGEVMLRGGADGSETPDRRRERLISIAAAALLASIPLTTVAAAGILTFFAESKVAALRQEVAPALAAEREAGRAERVRRALAVLFARPSATETLESLALAMPDSSAARTVERQADGMLRLEVETGDRAALEEGLARSPLLGDLHPAEILEEEGPRTSLVYRGRTR